MCLCKISHYMYMYIKCQMYAYVCEINEIEFSILIG